MPVATGVGGSIIPLLAGGGEASAPPPPAYDQDGENHWTGVTSPAGEQDAVSYAQVAGVGNADPIAPATPGVQPRGSKIIGEAPEGIGPPPEAPPPDMGYWEQPPPAYQEYDPTTTPIGEKPTPVIAQKPSTMHTEVDIDVGRPTCPQLVYGQGAQIMSMPVQRLELDVDCHVSVAYSKLRIMFYNNSGAAQNAVFVLPTEGSVTTLSAKIGDNRFYETSYISMEESQQFTKDEAQGDDPTSSYMPGAFRLPLANLPNNSPIYIEVEFLDGLEFFDGRYNYSFPMTFGHGIVPPGVKSETWLSVMVNINSALRRVQYGSSSHLLTMLSHEGTVTSLSAQNRTSNVSDLHLSYFNPTDDISGTTFFQPALPGSYDPRSSFVTFVNPPTSRVELMPRDIIFLYDRSGSMTGKPWQNGYQAICQALDGLRTRDRFGIVCFNHEQAYFSTRSRASVAQEQTGGLYSADERTLQWAKDWTRQQQAGGMTDIMTPLNWALQVLKQSKQQNRMQFVVLITDGAVSNEREIVKQAEANVQDIRLLTFGIGRYCNWYFLKMLALKSRGWSSGVLFAEDIERKMGAMIARANVPVLRDVEIVMDVKDCELYPPRIPDLFAGKPIILAGKTSTDKFPSSIQITGTLSSGRPFTIDIKTEEPRGLPVNSVFLKGQIDQLVAEEWLTQNSKIKQQLVDLSVNEKMPTPHTTMVAFEVPPEKKSEFDQHKQNNRKGYSAGQIAALGGGALVVGAGIFIMGDLLATGANASGLVDGLGDIFGMGDADCCDCGSCGDCLDGCGDGLGDCCGDVCDGIGDCFEGLGDCMEGICDALGSIDC